MIQRCSVLFLTAIFLLAANTVRAATISVDDNGIEIDTTALGHFTLSYPVFCDSGNNPVHKLIEKDAVGSDEEVHYDGGADVIITPSNSGVTFQFFNVPTDVIRFRLNMPVDFSFSEGGHYQVDSGSPQPFPAEQAANPNFLQTNAMSLSLTDISGRNIAFHGPDGTYFQLTDSRAWNWKMFQLLALVPIDSANETVKIGIDEGGTAASSAPVVLYDRYGQSALAQYAGKVTSYQELAYDLLANKSYYASMPPWPFDEYGGYSGSKNKLRLKATGYFHDEEAAGRWTMVDPDGNAYFMMGICQLGLGDDYTEVQGREGSFEWVPPSTGEFATAYMQGRPGVVSFYVANRIRKYGAPFNFSDWTAEAVSRAKGWGFNASGPFSNVPAANPAVKFPYTSTLPLDQWEGIPILPGTTGIWDPYDAKNRATVDSNFAAKLPSRVSDPYLIGYYLSNEPLFEDLPNVLPQLDGKYACKRAFVSFLSTRYQTVAAYNAAWAANAVSFDSLNDAGLAVTTDTAEADLQTFIGRFFDTYYSLVATTFHKYDPNHMLIGNRLQSGTINNETLMQVAGKYMDIISFNYYTCALDKGFLDRIYGWTGRPMILSEYYFDSPATTGLPGGLNDVNTQDERGLAYRDYVEHAAATPYILGTSWFTLVDEATSGRWFEGYNGEKANSGLISVTDRPYKDMVGEMMKTNDQIYNVVWGKSAPYQFDDPRFTVKGELHNTVSIDRAAGPIAMDGTTAGFPGVPATVISGQRLVLGADPGILTASFKLCWDDTNLYILADITDSAPMLNDYSGGNLWEGDCVELFVGPKDLDATGHPLLSDHQILLSGAPGSDPGKSFITGSAGIGIQHVVRPALDGKGYVLEAAIPFQALGFHPVSGQQIRFDMAIDDSSDGHGRSRQLVWNGTDRDSGDRTNWGTATFVH